MISAEGVNQASDDVFDVPSLAFVYYWV